MITTLLAAGADLRAQAQVDVTPLHIAASRGSPEAITTLLAAGADPLARDMGGRRPIDWVGEDSSLYDTAAYWQLNDATLNSQLVRITPLSCHAAGGHACRKPETLLEKVGRWCW